MANQFYVGQRVRVVDNSETWTSRSELFKKFGFKNCVYNKEFSNGEESIICAFELIGEDYIIGLEHSDGRQCIISMDGITTIDPPCTVLTDWQRKKINEHMCMQWGVRLNADSFAVVESILSEPEPPKYKPKHGEAVQLRDNDSDMWLVDVFYEMTDDGIYKGYNMLGKFCRPFDAALVGKVTND